MILKMQRRELLPEVKKPVVKEPIEIAHKEEEEIFKLPEKQAPVPTEESPETLDVVPVVEKPQKLDAVPPPVEKPKRKKRNPTEKQLEALRIARETRSRITAQKKGKSPEERLKEEEMEQLAYLESKYKRTAPQPVAPQPVASQSITPSIDYDRIPKTEVDYDRIINGVAQRYQAFHQQQRQEEQKKQANRTATIDMLCGRKGNVNRTFMQTNNIRRSFGNKFRGDW